MSEEKRTVVCIRCHRAIERCMLCEQVECADPLCYPDMLIVLGMSAPPLHLHGG